MSHTNLKFNGEGKITGGTEISIGNQNAWQHLINITEGDVFNGIAFEAGSSTVITAFADAGGGKVTVTAGSHGISEGDYVSITGTTNYNDLYQVTNVAENTFEITETFNGDDATGVVMHGTHAKIPAGGGGVYIYVVALSATAANANTTFEFTVVNGVITNGVTRRKFSTNTDVGSMIVLGMFVASEDDHISVAIRNITSSQNITINEGVFTLFKIA